MQPSSHQNAASKNCPYCAETIPLAAKKCRYCHEFIDKEAQVESLGRRIAAWLGIIAAFISVYYALREGYFYVQTQQQVRQQVSSYVEVADSFAHMDLLHLAEKALKNAQMLRPNDAALQKRLFLLQVDADLRDAGWLQNASLGSEEVDSLIMQGYRLIGQASNQNERADLNLALARVLNLATYKRHDIQTTFEKAQQNASNQADAKFYFGQWLLEQEVDRQKGFALLLEAIELAPGDALYRYEIAQAYLTDKAWASALIHIEQTLLITEAPRRIDRIRAKNGAKQQLQKLLLGAARDKKNDFWQELGQKKQQALLEQVLEYMPNNRRLNKLAAELYASIGEYAKARDSIEKVLSMQDVRQIQRGYYLEEFQLYKSLLQQLEPDAKSIHEIDDAFAHYEQNQGIEEVLEWGLLGESNYKIGLKVKKSTNGNGLKVLQAHSGYPFASAGVLPNDIILEVGHRPVSSLQNIGYVLRNFDKGSTVPIKLLRADKTENLTLILE